MSSLSDSISIALIVFVVCAHGEIYTGNRKSYDLNLEKLEIYEYQTAFRAILKIKATKLLKNVDFSTQMLHKLCESEAKNLADLAKCVVKLMDYRDRTYSNSHDKRSSRLFRYREQSYQKRKRRRKRDMVSNDTVASKISKLKGMKELQDKERLNEPKNGKNSRVEPTMATTKTVFKDMPSISKGITSTNNRAAEPYNKKADKITVVDSTSSTGIFKSMKIQKSTEYRPTLSDNNVRQEDGQASLFSDSIHTASSTNSNTVFSADLPTRSYKGVPTVSATDVPAVSFTNANKNRNKIWYTSKKVKPSATVRKPGIFEKIEKINSYLQKSEACQKFMKDVEQVTSTHLSKYSNPTFYKTQESTSYEAVSNMVKSLKPDNLFNSMSVLSPHLFALFPQERMTGPRLLSPEMLSFHADGFFSFPSIFETMNLSQTEMYRWMDILMSLTGATKKIDDILTKNKEHIDYIENVAYPKIVELQKRRKIWEKIEKSYSKSQKQHLDEHGYTFLTTKQKKLFKEGRKNENEADESSDKNKGNKGSVEQGTYHKDSTNVNESYRTEKTTQTDTSQDHENRVNTHTTSFDSNEKDENTRPDNTEDDMHYHKKQKHSNVHNDEFEENELKLEEKIRYLALFGDLKDNGDSFVVDSPLGQDFEKVDKNRKINSDLVNDILYTEDDNNGFKDEENNLQVHQDLHRSSLHNDDLQSINLKDNNLQHNSLQDSSQQHNNLAESNFLNTVDTSKTTKFKSKANNRPKIRPKLRPKNRLKLLKNYLLTQDPTINSTKNTQNLTNLAQPYNDIDPTITQSPDQLGIDKRTAKNSKFLKTTPISTRISKYSAQRTKNALETSEGRFFSVAEHYDNVASNYERTKRQTGFVFPRQNFSFRVRNYLEEELEVPEIVVLDPWVFGSRIGGILLEGIILSPAAFLSEVTSPSLLTLEVLSPTAFLASILSPLVLFSRILSPSAFRAEVLSPQALSSYILSPETLLAEVLAPRFMDLRIASGRALTVEILTPYVLSAKIGSPEYLSVYVMSPSILTPHIQSGGLLNLEVLSPHLLSGHGRPGLDTEENHHFSPEHHHVHQDNAYEHYFHIPH